MVQNMPLDSKEENVKTFFEKASILERFTPINKVLIV
jgi:hypothetical protein